MKKYGLDLEYIAIENGTVGMQALLANEAQFQFSTSSLAVNANLRGADFTVVVEPSFLDEIKKSGFVERMR